MNRSPVQSSICSVPKFWSWVCHDLPLDHLDGATNAQSTATKSNSGSDLASTKLDIAPIPAPIRPLCSGSVAYVDMVCSKLRDAHRQTLENPESQTEEAEASSYGYSHTRAGQPLP